MSGDTFYDDDVTSGVSECPRCDLPYGHAGQHENVGRTEAEVIAALRAAAARP